MAGYFFTVNYQREACAACLYIVLNCQYAKTVAIILLVSARRIPADAKHRGDREV